MAAGAIPYFSRLPTIDMLGLNDIHIAHEGERASSSGAGHDRFDAQYVLSKQPTFVVLSPMYEDGAKSARRDDPSREGAFAVRRVPA